VFKRFKQANEFRRLFPGSDYFVLPGQQKELFWAWQDAGCPGDEWLGKGRVPGGNTDLVSFYYKEVARLQKGIEKRDDAAA